jgi:MFS superfamily sulfate permease-like transporter
VLFIDVLPGMLIGLMASLLFVVYRSSRPHVAALGRVPDDPGAYTDLARHPENIPVPGVLIVRVDAPLYYANALTFRDSVMAMIAAAEPPLRVVVIDLEGQDEIDVTTVEMLSGMTRQLAAAGIGLYFAEVHAPVLQRARATGLVESVGEDHLFLTVDAAVRHVEAATASE